MKNQFCKDSDFTNEASVEALFVDRLLNVLKYPDNRVRRKESIEQISVGRGRKKEKYRPDYVLLDSGGMPKVVIDAKAPNEKLEDYHYQVSNYALYLNQKYSDKNPVLYTALTNGHFFIVYPWDSDRPVFFLRFENFADGDEKFLELRANLSFSAFNQTAATKDVIDFYRPNINALIRAFNECHNLIWKKEKIGPTDAFYEFSKIMFIKIREDNRIHSIINNGKKPEITDFIFSADWIDRESTVESNPFDSILFRQIQEDLERQIIQKKKKRIFEKGERLALKASTTYEVVKNLQHFDLYGIDEDLNGRMFETFLNATVRGKELGQFFTPRGVVHYMAETSPIFVKSNRSIPLSERLPYIIDGCCGSGGFLIDAMAQFVRSINNITTLTNIERESYIEELKNNHLFGIEANPKIVRISRLNMYLHGDGGSKIFKADTLDKDLLIEAGMTDEEQEGIKELKTHIFDDEIKFDIVLTNPPFSMKYKISDEHENRILEPYDIAKTGSGAQSSSEKSNVLFLERYMDILKPDTGELLTIIDDTVLNGDNSQRYREFILKNFIIIQVVSLPFNTFFRADANIKTSMIHLRKKATGESQGNIFMAITNNIGHDDHSRDTPERNNLHIVVKFFEEWRNGSKIEDQIIYNEHPDEPLGCPLQIFEVSPEEFNHKRFDAFYYAPELKHARTNLYNLEKEGKITIHKGSNFTLIPEIKKDDIQNFEGELFKYIEIGDVTIDGTIIKYREDYFEKLPTRARIHVKKGDVIFAKNNSSRGTTVLVPDWFDGGLVTTGFIGIRPNNEEEALILWNVLESEFFRKQIYYLSITASQPEVRENIFKKEMIIPWPKTDEDRKKIIIGAKSVFSSRNSLRTSLKAATDTFDNLLDLG
ncbi:MAG: N-6 DNA methylase [Candidatus Helarchaeota archaeon]